MRDHTVKVIGRRDLGPAAYRLDLEAPELAAAIRPGQFVMAGIPSGGQDPLLRRPLGYFGRDRGAGILSLLVQKVGRGTMLLGQVQPGQELKVLGPLGRGWTLPERGPVVLAGGGIGIVPLVDLAVQCAGRLDMVVAYGARCADELYLRDELADLPVELILATDDGSCGLRGTAIDALGRFAPVRFARYYGCGPRPMLSRLQSLMAAAGVAGELSLEERMACGFGACLGCVVALKDSLGEPVHKRVCTDGPVFPAGEVIFE